MDVCIAQYITAGAHCEMGEERGVAAGVRA